jgi:hypothetical protein
MKRFTTLVAVAVMCGASLSYAADVKEMPAGLWQITNKMDIPGLPPEAAAKMGNMTVTHCVKPGERRWNEQRAPMDRGDRKCDPSSTKVDGNKVSWSIKCADGTTGAGTLTHNGKDAFSMNMAFESPRGSMKMSTEGKKIAETCEKK